MLMNPIALVDQARRVCLTRLPSVFSDSQKIQAPREGHRFFSLFPNQSWGTYAHQLRYPRLLSFEHHSCNFLHRQQARRFSDMNAMRIAASTYLFALVKAYSTIWVAAFTPVASNRPRKPGEALTSITYGVLSTEIRSTPAISTPTASAALIETSLSSEVTL